MKYITFVTIYATIFIKYSEFGEKLMSQVLLKIIYQISLPASWAVYMIKNHTKFAYCIESQSDICRQWATNYQQSDNNIIINTLSTNNNNGDNFRSKELYYDVLKADVSSGKLTNEDAIADINLAFMGGMFTTSTALEQCILYLAQCGKEYQNELFDEIKSYDIKMLLKNVYNYNLKLTSFINEILRIHGGSFITLQRDITKENVKIECDGDNGENKIVYNIPRGTIVYGNIACIHHNSKHFGANVTKFDPKRFENNKKMKMIAFGTGIRDCPGQDLAKREIILVVAMLIKRYEFGIPNECDNDTTKFRIPKLFLGVKEIGVSVSLRNESSIVQP